MPSTQRNQGQPAADVRKKVTIWSVETGEPIERWPVDARGMVECGEYVTDPADLPEQPEPSDDADTEDTDSPTTKLSGGYRIEDSGGGWWKAVGPDGEQVGKSQRSEQDALDLIPATHRPSGAVGTPAEHSPGVPLQPDDGG